jgi:predicted nucleic acid-binding protein
MREMGARHICRHDIGEDLPHHVTQIWQMIVKDIVAIFLHLQIGRTDEELEIMGLFGALLEAKKGGFIAYVRQIILELKNTTTFHASDVIKEIISRATGKL